MHIPVDSIRPRYNTQYCTKPVQTALYDDDVMQCLLPTAAALHLHNCIHVHNFIPPMNVCGRVVYGPQGRMWLAWGSN